MLTLQPRQADVVAGTDNLGNSTVNVAPPADISRGEVETWIPTGSSPTYFNKKRAGSLEYKEGAQ